MMPCLESPVFYLSWSLVVGGALYFWQQTRVHTPYGRYTCERTRCCSARLGWFLQEVPSLLVPLLLLLLQEEETGTSPGTSTGTSPGTSTGTSTGRTLLLCTFMLHYFHRSCIYAFLTRGRPLPLMTVVQAAIFCSVNGFLQSHHLLHCTHFPHSWSSSARQAGGFLLFVVGLSINVHSDHILRNLRRPGEVVYRIPHGGMFGCVGCKLLEEMEWVLWLRCSDVDLPCLRLCVLQRLLHRAQSVPPPQRLPAAV
ncbi:3-oxo-5-alpha-steroid 4-dehydrogenase 2-like [Solea senegalensis]|uniref:3-oxo-5-alpha-steroid 4-dehydrogenase 2-like n=1 Tax=Solea senegalensis TaxID=28829 RepID=A0AAV6PBF1_SOLSE|nr:3-oxo-5-alpha-steroid 4-dehydrogenase 2-like [Solea senegalensis]